MREICDLKACVCVCGLRTLVTQKEMFLCFSAAPSVWRCFSNDSVEDGFPQGHRNMRSTWSEVSRWTSGDGSDRRKDPRGESAQ